MKKVFCKHCKYNWSSVIKNDYCCFSIGGSIFSGTDYNVNAPYNCIRKSEFNKNGDCSNFKLKWYLLPFKKFTNLY